MRKYIFPAILVAIIGVTIAIGIVISHGILNCGLSQLSNTKDLSQLNINLNYAWNTSDEVGLTETLLNLEKDQYTEVTSAKIIALVSPTGNIRQTEGSIGQEFTVNKVIKGNEYISIGDISYVYQYFGFRATDEHIEFLNTLNLMYPQDKYLIFMDPSPLNMYQEEPTYILKSDLLGYIKTQREDTTSLQQNYTNFNFADLSAYEFFSISDSITSLLNLARDNLLKMFC